MPKITYIESNGKEHVVDAPVGQTVMEAAVKHAVPGIDARPAASAAYLPGSPAASGPMTVAVMSAVVDSGPTDSCRDEPSRAYSASAGRAAQSPATGGSPARPEYAITCGMR